MKKKNSLGRKLAFASADIFGGGSFNIVNFLYPGFLALTVGLKPAWVGIIMLVSKFWDASIDPFIGFLSDKTKSKLGKRRIYLLIVAPLVLVSMYFLFFPSYRLISGDGLKVLAVVVSYLVFTAVQSLIMIPYYSLASEISGDYQQRASYNGYRLGFSIFSSIVCVALPKIIVNAFGNDIVGYQVMALSFGAVFMITILITALFAKEEIVTPPSTEKLNLVSLVKPLKLKSFRQYLYMHLMVQIPMAVMSSVFFFYTDFYVSRSEYAAGGSPMAGLIAAALLFSMQIVALPVYLKMIAKKSKTYVYRFGSLIWILAGIMLFFIPADGNPVYVYIIAALMGFGISAPGLIPHTMFGDVVDDGELVTGERLDGQMGGFGNFVTQLSQGVGVALVMFVLQIAGFREQVIGEPTILTQSDTAMLAVRLVLLLTPIIFLSVGSAVSYKYKIDAKVQGDIRLELDARQKQNGQ